MAVTPQLLARLGSLDDLLELAAALGYEPGGDELNTVARRRLGLDGAALGTRRAAIVGRHGTYQLYGLVATGPTRSQVAAATERLARATPGSHQLLLVLDAPATTLAVAAVAPRHDTVAARQLRIALQQPSPVSAEILGGLAVRPRDSATTLAVRATGVLEEEGLTRRFFRDFSRFHAVAAARLTGMPRCTEGERSDLALVILTRVLFLYFVQSRGWLAGRSDFLPSLLDTALGRGHPFHRTVFEPLCFGALNAPPERRTRAARLLGDLPFLNGGLFERHAIERRFPAATLDNATWRALFDELFERFHFTVRERDDADAVDPEMLGRVFEGLMVRERRRHQGTYFTPRHLLQDTVGRALDAAFPAPDPERVRRLRVLDPAVGSGAFLLEVLRRLERARGPLVAGERPADRRRSIVRDNLFGVDLDPMAVRLAELRLWLALLVDDDARLEEVAPLPNLDQNLRQGDSLLSPLEAARGLSSPAVARVRAVAERHVAYFGAFGRDKAALARAIRADERGLALEAADAGIASLTSRLADAAAGSGRDLFGRRPRRTAGMARRVAVWRRERRELITARRRIASDDVLPFFAYEIHFAPVMAEGGFDLVVGNPPWIRGERLQLSTRKALARRYLAFRAGAERKGFAHLPDLSVAFVERALDLAKTGGVVSFLLPSKLLRAGYAGPLRALIRRTAQVAAVADLSHDADTGFAATVFPMVMVLRKGSATTDAPAQVSLASASGKVVCGVTTQRDLGLDEDAPGSPWLALPADVTRAVRQALGAGPRLGACFRPLLGVKTGANEVFLRSLPRADELPRSCRRLAVLGRDVSPFAAHPSHWVLAAIDARGAPLERPPDEVVAFLAPFAPRLARRSDARDAPPWALFRTDLLRGPWLVIWRDIAPRLEAAPLCRGAPDSPVPLNTCYGVAVADAYTACWLAAYLNSGPIRDLAAAMAERASGGAYRFSATTVGALPLPSDPQGRAVRILADIGATAMGGGSWEANDLDAPATLALGLASDVSAQLKYLGDTLRRDAGRHC
ncbi:MAG TPA: N-6 DNA methylase [Gemmatimonadales bacterium]|nr:N-6 DNA methylase [Gemmatimonadales bacterium]